MKPANKNNNNFLPRIHPKISSTHPQRIVKIKSTSSLKPYCLIKTKQYQEKINCEQQNRGSESIYKDGYYYMTEYEREKLENDEKKRKNIAGEFRGYSGVASSLPVRKEGLVRTSSKYISPLQPHPKDKNIPLYGVWQPSV